MKTVKICTAKAIQTLNARTLEMLGFRSGQWATVTTEDRRLECLIRKGRDGLLKAVSARTGDLLSGLILSATKVRA